MTCKMSVVPSLKGRPTFLTNKQLVNIDVAKVHSHIMTCKMMQNDYCLNYENDVGSSVTLY